MWGFLITKNWGFEVTDYNRKIILSAINELPEKCKEIFIKCKINGLTYPKVADDLKISVKTVEAQMSIALRRLRKKLDWLLILFLT